MLLTIFEKLPTVDVWHISGYVSGSHNPTDAFPAATNPRERA